jgi:hypothetical protein
VKGTKKPFPHTPPRPAPHRQALLHGRIAVVEGLIGLKLGEGHGGRKPGRDRGSKRCHLTGRRAQAGLRKGSKGIVEDISEPMRRSPGLQGPSEARKAALHHLHKGLLQQHSGRAPHDGCFRCWSRRWEMCARCFHPTRRGRASLLGRAGRHQRQRMERRKPLLQALQQGNPGMSDGDLQRCLCLNKAKYG